MRLLFVAPYYFPEHKFGGPPRKVHSIARGLVARGHNVEVATFDSMNPQSHEYEQFDGVSVQYLPWMGRGLRQFPHRRDLLAEAIGRSDLVHCYGLYNLICPTAIRLARRLGRPIVLEPLGMYPPRAGNTSAKSIYNATLTNFMTRRAMAVVAASKAEAAELGEIVSADKIVFRRNGIDATTYQNLPNGDAFREKWDISPNEKIILFIGRLSPIKNLEQLLLAFAKADVPLSRLVLVGPSEVEYEKRLRALGGVKGITEKITFAGPLYDEDQKAALGIAGLFVLPSLNESFGNAAGEAVAAGVSVLLTDTCGIAPLIHKRAGLAVPLGVDSLADGLRKMLNPEIRRQMTARRGEVKRELSWDEPIRQTEELYRDIIAKWKVGIKK